jgi:hypothetical protein
VHGRALNPMKIPSNPIRLQDAGHAWFGVPVGGGQAS